MFKQQVYKSNALYLSGSTIPTDLLRTLFSLSDLWPVCNLHVVLYRLVLSDRAIYRCTIAGSESFFCLKFPSPDAGCIISSTYQSGIYFSFFLSIFFWGGVWLVHLSLQVLYFFLGVSNFSYVMITDDERVPKTFHIWFLRVLPSNSMFAGNMHIRKQVFWYSNYKLWSWFLIDIFFVYKYN